MLFLSFLIGLSIKTIVGIKIGMGEYIEQSEKPNHMLF